MSTAGTTPNPWIRCINVSYSDVGYTDGSKCKPGIPSILINKILIKYCPSCGKLCNGVITIQKKISKVVCPLCLS